MRIHPRDALFAGEAAPISLPVVDHYSGSEKLMRKSLALQAARGPVFDVTLDCEDGAQVGAEEAQVRLAAELLASPDNRYGRVGVRVHPVDHPAFAMELQILAAAPVAPAYLMLPKVDSRAQLDRGAASVQAAWGARPAPPLQALIETHGGLREVEAIAAHPALQSLSFGLMDFVSGHHGAIPRTALSLPGQFEHPLVARAKLAIAAAAHGHGKVPSHCVVTELKSPAKLQAAAERAAREFGYTRMWSIHPDQIQPILDAFAPSAAEVDEAIEVLEVAQDTQWGPIRLRDQLHDRASYRLFWSLLQRAHQTGQALPAQVRERFFS
ncbi:citrate lyase subunit beta/citryl-CoA lyase [Inhella inkyongensis]|uniref:Citrate lyase subunit beta/citryl-CoA lyase n=1 Tax=Inhella inkyongensis TaxID=392593 RepID=A0A840S4S0_9BURK|nr:aldolase/citrate lyase family protein [Inhella inkyongensis]MBB5206307.1 citrate lyase subunit beta/citryl-CoA lyase [Inhella inkyongensis]